MRYDSGATQKVKEKMREAMLEHFTGSGDGTQVCQAAKSGRELKLGIVPHWFYS